MKAVQAYFNVIFDAIYKHLEDHAKVVANRLFGFKNEQYGFDIGEAKDIDEWLNTNYPENKVELSQKSKDIFNSLFKLYHANSHLMLMYKMIKFIEPKYANRYQIFILSKEPEILDFRKSLPNEVREDIDQQILLEVSNRNNRRALGVLINHGISLPMELPYGDIWYAAIKLDKTVLSTYESDEASLIINAIAQENLEKHEENEKPLLARNNMISICSSLLIPDLVKDDHQNFYLKYDFNSSSNKNIDAWLSTHSPYKDDLKKTILEPETKEILNNLFKLHSANENLTYLQSLLSTDPDFCKLFKIVQLSQNPIIFDVVKKSLNEFNESEPIKSEEIEKYLQKNLASGTRLMKDKNMYMPVRKAEDYTLPLTTPKRLNFKFNKISDDEAKIKMTSAAKENSMILNTIKTKNHPERSHTPSPPRAE